jgi:hypothetical protein
MKLSKWQCFRSSQHAASAVHCAGVPSQLASKRVVQSSTCFLHFLNLSPFFFALTPRDRVAAARPAALNVRKDARRVSMARENRFMRSSSSTMRAGHEPAGKQQTLPQTTRPGGQGAQPPLTQIDVASQGWLQAPQLARSFWTSTQWLPQQREPPGQAVMQSPQWRTSVAKSTHVPPQQLFP